MHLSVPTQQNAELAGSGTPASDTGSMMPVLGCDCVECGGAWRHLSIPTPLSAGLSVGDSNGAPAPGASGMRPVINEEIDKGGRKDLSVPTPLCADISRGWRQFVHTPLCAGLSGGNGNGKVVPGASSIRPAPGGGPVDGHKAKGGQNHLAVPARLRARLAGGDSSATPAPGDSRRLDGQDAEDGGEYLTSRTRLRAGLAGSDGKGTPALREDCCRTPEPKEGSCRTPASGGGPVDEQLAGNTGDPPHSADLDRGEPTVCGDPPPVGVGHAGGCLLVSVADQCVNKSDTWPVDG